MPKILIVEDDLMIADMTEEVLIDNGCEVCGIARTVAEAVAMGQLHRPDLALIDLRLADNELGSDIPAQLGMIGRFGVLYATGNMSFLMLSGAQGDACISKPYRAVDLLRGLEIVSDIVAKGVGSPPFPRGFHLLNQDTLHVEAPHD